LLGRHRAWPLSFAQEASWRFAQENPLAPNQITARLRLTGTINRQALLAAFDRIVARHEVLRTTFRDVGGEPSQMIDAPGTGFALAEQKLRGGQTVEQISLKEAMAPFDMAAGPLIRGRLISVSKREHVLLITAHRTVGDRASLCLLIKEWAALYAKFAVGREGDLPRSELQYADYARWMREQLPEREFQKQLEFWSLQLAGAPDPLWLSKDRAELPAASYGSAQLRFQIPEALRGQLQTLSEQQGVTLFIVLLSAWALALSHWSGREEMVIGTRVAKLAPPEFGSRVGVFENILPLRLQWDPQSTVAALLKHTQSVLLKASANQEVPSELLSVSPHVLVSDDSTPVAISELEGLQVAGLKLSDVQVGPLSAHAEMSVSLCETGLGSTCVLEYAAHSLDQDTIEKILSRWQAVLAEIGRDVRRPISALSPRTPEIESMLPEFNRTEATYDQNRLIHELFEEQVREAPDAVAVLHNGRSLSYAQINAQANQLARYLRAQGVVADQVVGICVERSVEMVVGLLGILKAGAAYVPLDPNYPAERLQYMLEDAAPQVVLTQKKLSNKVRGERVPVLDLGGPIPEVVAQRESRKLIALDTQQADFTAYGEENLSSGELGLSAEQLVYVIYTSGSTGQPKGTGMEHRSMVNLIEWHRRSFGSGAGKRVLQFAALSFDVAFQEIFSTLCTGASLVLLDEWVRRDARALSELLKNQSVQRLFVPPLMLQSLAESCAAIGDVPPTLEDVITAGEQLRISAAIVSLFKQLPGCRLHNHYGPTETHVVTALRLEGDPQQWPALPSIGRPISNTQIYILNEQRQAVPLGVAGEIYIGGANVARGYRGRAELTAQRFIQDPYSAEPQARLYKTGDLGRWKADGTIEYLGRNDDQVKIRGFRIELGEIESQLATHASVREVAVVAREDVPGEKRLVAYLTASAEGELKVEELRAHLKGRLPEHMVPSAFVVLESLPLTPSGKLNRRVLPAPELGAYVSRAYEAPQGEVEEILAGIWQELLRVERVGRADNFFELGGHSLHGVKLIGRIEERLQVKLSVVAIFQYPTIQALAAVIEPMRAVSLPAANDEMLEFEEGML
jgi:amino acid adenylation domain-containing protein